MKTVAIIFLLCPMAFGASHYVCSAATGSHNGTDWTNAWTTMAQITWTRGDLYYFACSNSFSAVTFSAANSGTTTIELRAATIADHGTSTGWLDTMVAQTVWTGITTFSTDYWTVNGQQRGSDWQSGYLLKFWNQSSGGDGALETGGTNRTNLTFKYIEVVGTGLTGGTFPSNTTADKCSVDNCGVWGDNTIYTAAGSISNLYFGYSWAHHTGNTQFQMNGAVSNTATWEYNWISYNHTGQNGIHDEAYSLYGSNVIIRYNVFQDISGTGQITDAGAGSCGPALSNWDIYGNLFFWDDTYRALGKGTGSTGFWEATSDTGLVTFLGENMSGFIHFYNNTIANIMSPVATNGGAFNTTAVTSVNAGVSCGSPTLAVENNLWYGSASTGASQFLAITGTADYNAYYQGGLASGLFGSNSETHGVVVTGSTSPFVNSSLFTVAGYQLAVPDSFSGHPGVTLASPYNLDGIDQVTRGANGTWDRGALQLGSGVPPAAPTALFATVAQDKINSPELLAEVE